MIRSFLISRGERPRAPYDATCGDERVGEADRVLPASHKSAEPTKAGRMGTVGLGVENVQDGADQQRVAGLLPVIAPLKGTLRIDQDVGDVLDVAHLVRSFAHLQERVVAGRPGVRRIEQQASASSGRASRR